MTSDCSKLDIPVPVTVDRVKAPEILYALNVGNGRVFFFVKTFFFSAFKTRKDEIKGRKRRTSTCTSSRYTLLCVVVCKIWKTRGYSQNNQIFREQESNFRLPLHSLSQKLAKNLHFVCKYCVSTGNFKVHLSQAWVIEDLWQGMGVVCQYRTCSDLTSARLFVRFQVSELLS